MNKETDSIGDPHGFSRIYRRFHRPILDYALGRIRDPEAAEEVTQEVFLKVYRSRESFQPQYALSTWIWTIARNTVFDWIRKHGPQLAHHRDSMSDVDSFYDEIPCSRPTAENILIERSHRQRLREGMRKLTRVQRKILLLRLVRQLSCQEIARRLGLSLPSVKCSLYRARLSLASVS